MPEKSGENGADLDGSQHQDRADQGDALYLPALARCCFYEGRSMLEITPKAITKRVAYVPQFYRMVFAKAECQHLQRRYHFYFKLF